MSSKETEDKSTFTLAATGESFITLRLAVHDDKRFMDMVKILRDADIAFTNLETLIHDYEGYPIAKSEEGTYPRAPPIVADDLKWAGIGMVSQVNNHSIDYGYEGMFVTSKHLDRVGIAHAGTGKDLDDARSPAYIETSRARVALVATTPSFASWWRAGSPRDGVKGRPGINPLRFETTYTIRAEQMANLRGMVKELGIRSRSDERGLQFSGLRFVEGDKPGIRLSGHKHDVQGNLRSIGGARKQADLVFVSIHSHEHEGDVEVPASFVQEFCRASIDIGADAILGHGPHMIRGIEIYKGKPIFYSLGNFVFQNQQPEKLPEGEYEGAGMGLDATPGDFYDMREYGSEALGRKPNNWYSGDMRYWRGVIAQTKFSIEPQPPPIKGQPFRPGAKLTEIKLYPVTLQYMNPRSRRGWPILAEGAEAKEIIDHIKKLSEPFGTEITYKEDVGTVKLKK